MKKKRLAIFVALSAISSAALSYGDETSVYPVAGHNQCLCTFDMDLTIAPATPNGYATPGAQEAIQSCMAHKCGIAINTTEWTLVSNAYTHYWSPGAGLTENQSNKVYQYIYGDQTYPTGPESDVTVQEGDKDKCSTSGGWKPIKVCNLPHIIDAYSHDSKTQTKYSCIFHFDDSVGDLNSLYQNYGDKGIKLILVTGNLQQFYMPENYAQQYRDDTGIWYSDYDSSGKTAGTKVKADIDALMNSTNCF